MALEINIIRAKSDATKAPRMPLNLVETSFAGWAPINSGSGAAPSVTGGTNGDTVVFAKSSLVAGKSYVGTSFTGKAGKSYAVGCYMAAQSGTLDTEVNNIFTNASISAGETGIRFSNVARWFCTRFTCDTDGTILVRLGIGCDGDDDATSTSLTLSKPFVYEIESATANCPEYVAGWGNQTSAEQRAAAFSYANGNTVAASGQITLNGSEAVPLAGINPYTVGLFVSDSFGNSETEWPQLMVNSNGHLLLLGNSTSGDSMADMDTRLNDVLNMDSFDYTGNVPPTFAILQGSVNSPNESQTADQMIATVASMIDKTLALDIAPIVTNIAPYGQGAGFAIAKGQELAAYNQRLQGVCAAKGVAHVDIYSLLVGTDGYSLKAAYDSGDGVHPNEAGSQVIANALNQALVSSSGAGAFRAVTYIPSQKEAATSSPFVLQPSQELQVFAAPDLEENEYVTIEVYDAIQGWRTMGVVVNQFDSNGFIQNNKRVAQQYRLTKSATRSSTRIESN